MSWRQYTEIICNGPGNVLGTCGNAFSDAGNASEVRRDARDRAGWIVNQPGGKDYCSAGCRQAAKVDAP